MRFSGATVHFVEEAYDTGPVLAQRAVPVLPDDTPAALAARVLVQVSLGVATSAVGSGAQMMLWSAGAHMTLP